jgi:hypothetical protein
MAAGFCLQRPSAKRQPKKRKAMTPNLRISFLSIEDEFMSPLFGFFPERLFLLAEQKTFHKV